MTELLIAGSGPLARVWLASHWERKVSKSQFLQTNLEKTIDAITTQDHEPLTLRMSGQLLLGVVRIYSRKTRYLLEDCNEALVKIKLSFKKGNVNMPDIQHTVASIKSITLPEKLTEFDILLPDEPLLDMEMDTMDAVLDSASQLASSQDITLSDIQDLSFGFEWDINHTAETERARLNEEVDQIDQLDVGSVEMGRRDNEPNEFGREPSFSDDINEPLGKMNLNEQQPDDYVDFDDFDFGDDGGVFAQDQDTNAPPAGVEEFHRADDSQFMEGSSLMHSGLVPDDEDDQLMFETQPMEVPEAVQPRRRRRRLIVDLDTEIPHEQLRANLADTSTLINRDANTLRNNRKSSAKKDWKRPTVISSHTKIGQLYARLNSTRNTNTDEVDAFDMTRAQSPEMVAAFGQQQQQPGEAAGEEGQGILNYQQPDDYMDFDDFDFGDAPAPTVQEENAESTEANENTSQFNNNTQNSQFSRSTHETLEQIQNRLVDNNSTLTFGELAPTHNSTRSDVARRFYDVLLLTTKDMIKVQQSQAFGEIQIAA
ncbi:Rec8 like protein-domain-containing protein [Phascolomyces articulosus]|uniref:Rec8 like protein-domain-containing protein n=1 Tax=Phascolomyces articulosus TaxID=60185 RepID=A0AAD5JZW3_9FUNG|nr:Rec8 like protein-domain-containing protein [Phascolomyces articulosus]